MSAFCEGNALSGSAGQADRNCRIVRRFLKEAGISGVDQITSGAVREYLAGQAAEGRSKKTLANHRGALSAFCEFLVEGGALADNPVRRVKLGRLPDRLPVFLDEAEVAQALELARGAGIFAEVCVAIHTGLRAGEMRRLAWADVDLENKRLTVRQSKSGRKRTVWLNRPAWHALFEQNKRYGHLVYVFPGATRGTFRGWNEPVMRGEDWWRRRGLRPLQEAMPKFRLSTGVGRGWHLFRHTFASRAVQRGVSLYKLSRWLGHASLESTRLYAHLSTEFDADIERLA